MSIKVSSVKLSAKIPESDLRVLNKFCLDNNIRTKWFNRSHLVVNSRFTFVLFKKGANSWRDQHVNVLKLKMDEIQEAIAELSWLLDIDSKEIFYEVDNITATSDLNMRINIEDFIEENYDINFLLAYNPERFPGLFIRGNSGKIILFRSGKVVFVGSKNLEEIEDLLKWVKKKCEKTKWI